MRRSALVAVMIVAGLAAGACSDPAANSNPAPTTPTDETAAVCADVAAQTKTAAASLKQLLLDLTAARATKDTQAQAQVVQKLETTARDWSVGLAAAAGRAIKAEAQASLAEQVTKLDTFVDAAHNQPARLNPAGSLEFVERAAKSVYWACGYTPEGAPN